MWTRPMEVMRAFPTSKNQGGMRRKVELAAEDLKRKNLKATDKRVYCQCPQMGPVKKKLPSMQGGRPEYWTALKCWKDEFREYARRSKALALVD